MIAEARQVVDWTRERLDAAQLAFLAALPLTARSTATCLFVHANAWAPAEWAYVDGRSDAVRSLQATAARFTFCGHVHEPTLYHLSGTGKAGDFEPTPGIADPAARRSGAGSRSPARPASRATATRPRATRCSTTDSASPHLPPRAVRHRGGGAKIRAAGLPERLADAPATMASERQPAPPRARSQAGQVIDGFRLEERAAPGRHGEPLARQPRRRRATHALPLIMKVPRIKGGEDPAAIVGFEVEQMIMPTLTGPHVPTLRRHGRLHRASRTS